MDNDGRTIDDTRSTDDHDALRLAPPTVGANEPAQRAHGRIQSMLVRFDLRPGDRINEVELASALGVSRTPVREALNRLSTEGFVTFVPNRGFFVRELQIREFTELYELRAGIEGVAALHACRTASDAAIAALDDQWQSTLATIDSLSGDALGHADERFHEQLVALAGNQELNRVIRNINLRIRFVRQCAIEHPEQRAMTVAEHAGILRALGCRDEATARSLVEAHVSMTADKALDYITRSLARIYLKV